MTGLFTKFRTLAIGKAHDLLDKAIDENSPTMLRQYVRDLETSMSALQTEAAVAAGGVRTITREKGDLENRLKDETIAAGKALNSTAPNKDVLARAHGSAAVSLQSQIASKAQELTEQQALSADLDSSYAKLDAKHTQMVTSVRRLESMDRSTKAKEHAAGVMSSAAAASASGSGVSIDSIEQKMSAAKDVADVKFERAMNDPSMAEDPAHAADVDSFLAGLK